MLNLIHAAEVQYRHDTARLERDLLVLARIAEREMAPVAPRTHRWASVPKPVVRAAWPRPISEHGRVGATVALAGPAAVCC